MTGYRLSPLAQADLYDIWTYTETQWGGDQAKRYVREIEAAIVRIAAWPTLGQSCDDVRAGYRRFRAGAHRIFYTVDTDWIDVIRILHERMDVAGRL